MAGSAKCPKHLHAICESAEPYPRHLIAPGGLGLVWSGLVLARVRYFLHKVRETRGRLARHVHGRMAVLQCHYEARE